MFYLQNTMLFMKRIEAGMLCWLEDQWAVSKDQITQWLLQRNSQPKRKNMHVIKNWGTN